jgi:hypothetical protein
MAYNRKCICIKQVSSVVDNYDDKRVFRNERNDRQYDFFSIYGGKLAMSVRAL